MTTPTVGDLVARRYEIRGAPRQFPGYMGYRAFDREVEVEVALWWVRPELYPGAADRAAFLRAAEVSRAMKNPNARRLFDAGEHDGGLFATVQLAAHQPKVATPTDAELLDRAVALCDALGRAHEDGFAHGRLVPDDVVHVNGLLKIGGIGLWGGASSAREVWGEAGRYVAPEAWSQGGVTPRADVFSAGVILAELASGGGSAWRRTGDVRDLADELALARADVAAELGAALALDPARRTPSMPALLAALRGALVDESLPTAQHLAVPPAEPGAHDRLATDAGQLRGAPPEVSAIDRVADASADTRDYVKVAEHELDADDLLPVEDAPEAVAPAHAELPPPIAADDATRPFVRGAGEALQLPLAAGPPSVRMPAVVVPAQGARRERGLWPYVLAGLVAAVGVGLIVWVSLASYFGGDDAAAVTPGDQAAAVDASRPAAPARAPAEPILVAPGPSEGPCAAGMTQVEGFCIDTHESPGEGRLPETGMALADAERACRDRGARLCTADEWERACRGPRHTSFPYGDAYRRGKCNTDLGGSGSAAVAGGSLLECRSEEGVYDLSGNVAEWVAGGRPRGGSAQDATDGRCSRRRRAKPDRGHSDVGFRCCADPR